MASTGNKSNLYPTVHSNENGSKHINGDAGNDVQVNLLRPPPEVVGHVTGGQGDSLTIAPGVAWYKKDYTETELEDTAQDQLVQDVSSTAVLTRNEPDEDDLDEDISEPDDRGNWSGRFDFLMSLLGYSVGLGNVWRFPYLAYSNGGGAFLFPFILMFMLLGFPLMFMELSFGQFAALGPAGVFDRICPILTGLGYGMIAVSSMVALYYTVIIGWAFLYLFKSFTSELPWERCHSDWKTPTCYSHIEAEECHAKNGSIYYQNTCYSEEEAANNSITEFGHNKSDRAPPAEDFFEQGILGISGGIEEVGTVQWQIMLCLALTWFLTFLALSRGVKSVGKVVYFTALFPYLVLTILFFRGITLDGSKDGIIYYLTPNFEKLIEAKTWVSAAVQIFFALSPAWGGLITLSSYNKFHNDCFKDSMIVGVGNICTSIFAGFVIFSIVGYLAKELEMDVDKVVEQGPGLAFIVFPDVVTRLPLPPLWSFLFFFMLITLGMGSEFALLETVMTAVQDTYPPLRQKKVYVVLIVSIIGFLGGLPICTQGGMYILQLMDTYAASWAVFIMAILECVILGWIYGADKFLQDIEMMIGRKNKIWHMFFTIFWKFITPATLIFLLLFNWFDYSRMSYAGKVYPVWAELIGWVMAFVPVIIIISMGIWKYYRAPQERSTKEKIRRMLRASPKWGPAHKVPKYDLEDGIKSRTVTNPGFGSAAGNPFETRI